MLKTFFYLAFGLGSNYLFNIYLARQLGANQFGLYSLALTLFNITVLLAACGLDQAAVRFIPRIKQSEVGKTSQLITSLAWLELSASIIGAAVFFVSGYFLLDTGRRDFVWIFACCILPLGILNLGLAILQGHHILGARLFIKYMVEPLVKISTSVLLIFFGFGLSAPALGMLAAFIISAAILFLGHGKYFRCSLAQPNRPLLREIIEFCSPLVAASVFTVVAARADILIVGTRLSSSSAALYAAALQTSAILAIVLQAIEMVSTSRFAASIAAHDLSGLEAEFKKTTRWSIILGMPLGLTMIVNAEFFMHLFGADFSGAETVFSVLCISQLFNLATGPANPLLIMAGKTRAVMRNDMLYGVALVISVYIGASFYGLLGAACAAAIVNSALNILRVWCVHKLIGIQPYSVYLMRPMLAGLLAVILNSSLRNTLGGLSIVTTPAMTAALILIFGLHCEDKNLFISWAGEFRLKWKKFWLSNGY